MSVDPTTKPIVHTLPDAENVVVERDIPYSTEDSSLSFDLYRPLHTSGPSAVLLFVSGYPDPGMVAMLGKPLKEWASYQGWARNVAASGIAAITYRNRTPADVLALLAHLRTHADALGLDPASIGVWSCSGNAPTALGLVAKEKLACAALLYPFLIDVDGGTTAKTASQQFHFALPSIAIAELPREMPMLLVRAGRDTTPGLDQTLQRFVAAAQAEKIALELVEHPEAPHAFDILDDSSTTHVVIERVLAFLREHLGSGR